MNFGEFVRTKRLEHDLSLRRFCLDAGLDPSNWSKIERDRLPVTSNREQLESIAKVLKLKKGSDDYHTFFNLAYISQQKIPDDIYSDAEVMEVLPVFFRTVQSGKPSKEELNQLIKLLKSR